MTVMSNEFISIVFEEENGEAIPRICDQENCLATFYSFDCFHCPYNACDLEICPITKDGFSFCWLTAKDVIVQQQNDGHFIILHNERTFKEI